jgi:bacillithiol biosynthesis deacetylase BshB1
MSVDVLAIGAHPDDADLGLGGTLLLLAAQGFSTAILDLTQGEAASRGTPEERLREADKAARVLQVRERYNAELPDGGLANTPEQRMRIVPFIRALRPSIILNHHPTDRHPDHAVAHDLVRDANFFAGVASIETDEEPYRAPHIYLYHPYQDSNDAPAFVMDISDFLERKLRALQSYKSQLHNPNYAGPETYVSSPEFWEFLSTRAAYWGNRVGVAYGEPIYASAPFALDYLPGLRIDE